MLQILMRLFSASNGVCLPLCDSVRHLSQNGVRVYIIYMVVVAFSSRARILGGCSTIHFPSAFFSPFKWRLARAY